MAGHVPAAHAQAALLFICSNLKPSSTATWDQYHRYYEDELIPTLLKLPMFNQHSSAVRYKNVSASPTPYPFAALYPLRDVQFLHVRDRIFALGREVPTKAFNGDTGIQHIDFASFSYRYLYTLDGRLDDERPGRAGTNGYYPLTMIADSFDGYDDPSSTLRADALFKARYQLPWRFGVCEPHLRSVVYKLMMGKAPRYLVLHTFAREHELLGEDVLGAGTAEQGVERQVYSLRFSRGEMIYPPPPVDIDPLSSPGSPTPERTEPGVRRSSEITCSPNKSPPPLTTATSWDSV